MSSILVAAAIMGGLGVFLAIVLAISYRFLRVWEDPRIDVVEGLLPGSNCGACGQPGCRAFAEKLVAGETSPAQCTVSSPTAVESVAGFLGVDAGEADRRVARLHCAGGKAQAPFAARYAGHESCRAAALVAGGAKGCSWGCLGLGDCDTSCDFDAIEMNENALPVVDIVKCTACGDCVDACPRDLFELLPMSMPLLVQCSAPLAGDEAIAVCTVACDACGRCALDAPAGLISMVNNLPVIDVGAHLEYSATQRLAEATRRCPTGAIQYLMGGQFWALSAPPPGRQNAL